MKSRITICFGVFLVGLGVILWILPFTLQVSSCLFLFFGGAVLALEWIARKTGKRRLQKVLSAVLWVGAGILAALCVWLSWEGRSDDISQVDVEFVVVLGAQVQGDQPSRTLQERLDLAVSYLQRKPDACVVVSGGQVPDEAYTEAEVMYRYLEEQGINPERILLEKEATNTRENLQFSMDVAHAQGIDTHRVLLITSEFHMPRAKYIASTLGMDPLGLSSETTPKILLWNYYLREIFAFAKAIVVAALSGTS